jgi:hypothetical protein
VTPIDALDLAYQVIMHAACEKPHSPWCNGVHEGSACEGDYQFAQALEEIEKVLTVHGTLVAACS